MKKEMGIGSIFANVYEEIKRRLIQTPLDRKLVHQILVDLQRTRSPITGNAFSAEEGK